MKRGSYRKWPQWTANDDRLLRIGWRNDRYDREIGAALNRCRHDVGHRRRWLGMSGVKYRGHTPEICEKIRAADYQRWANPRLRARMLAGVRKANATRWGRTVNA